MENILNTPMYENDAGAKTIREYLMKLLLKVWSEGEGFNGKRPFGNSGWENDIYRSLKKCSYVDTFTLSEDECKLFDRDINAAIRYMCL